LYRTENRSHTAGSSILDTLPSATQVASPVRGTQYIRLGLDDAGLHLMQYGFAFLQAQADLFWRDRWPFHLADRLAFYYAACQTRLHPNSELHRNLPIRII
jgi:hypothetical protein